MKSDDPIERLLEAVSDRRDADWDELERTSNSNENRSLVRNLRALRDIAEHGAPLPRYELPRRSRPDGADDPFAMPSAEFAKTWAHLTLLEKVGEGAYGEVFRAWDPKLSIDVALKLTPATLATPDEAMREARMLARVHHPNVARVYGADRADGAVGIWTEFVDGVTLRDLVREEAPIAGERLVEIARRILEALAAIHDAKILHRDLKPENVLVAKDGRLVVTDFGCGALRTSLAEDRRTEFAGTPRFLAPELFRGGAPTPGTDCYALGVILFQLATGRYPIEAKNVEALRAAHREGSRRRLAEDRKDLPPGLASSIDRALEPDPSRRFRSASEWLAALNEPASTSSAAASTPSSRALRRAGRWALAACVGIACTVAWALFARSTRPLEFRADLLRSRGDGAWSNLSQAGDASVRVGDRLMLSFDSPHDAHVYVINWDDAGRAYLLFPMMSSGLNNPLPGGTSHRLPGPVAGEPFAWEVSSAGGVEHFAVVSSRDRLVEFERIVGDLSRVHVEGPSALSPNAMGGLLRGVGRASPFEGASGAVRPEQIIEQLQRRLAEDRSLRRKLAVRVLAVESSGD